MNAAIIPIILLSLGYIAMLICFWFHYRNSKVYDFRMSILHSPLGDSRQQVIIFSKLPEYEKMLHSTTPLKYKNYLSQEDIDTLGLKD